MESVEVRTCSFVSCKNIPPPGRKLCQRCLDRASRKSRERISLGLCAKCKNPALPGRKRCKKCAERANAYAKTHKTSMQSHYRYQNIVYDYYGRKCSCCGEDNPLFLTMDHINGRKDTPEKKKTGAHAVMHIARAIILGEPRTDIRILCFNCNCGRHRNGGICPHEVKQ